MKKLIISLSALAALLLAGSCQRENLEPVEQGGTVTYTVQMPGALATKTAGDYELIYEVYRETQVGTGAPIYEGKTTFSGNSVDLPLEFVKDQNFVVLFWAQKVGLTAYNTGDLRNVTISAEHEFKANNADYEVFAGNDTVLNCQSQKNGEVSLVRPVAQINIATTKAGLILSPVGSERQKHVEVVNSDVTVYGLWNSFNVATNNVLRENVAGNTTVEFTVTDSPAKTPNSVEYDSEHLLVAKSYVGFIPQNGATVKVDFNLVTSDDGTINHEVSNVPVKPNFKTNIIGNLISATADYNVTLEETWTTPEVVYSVWDGESISEPTLDATAAQPTYVIDEASDLAWFAAAVNGTLPQTRSGSSIDDFKDKTFKLTSDIDLAGHEWTPISMSTDLAGGKTFRGTFDGNGHTIYGLTVNQQEVAGLFGYVYACTIKNVIVDGASINSNHYAGGIVGWVLNNKGNIQVPFVIENCHVKNSTITSTPVQVNGQWDNGDKVGGLVGYAHFEDPDKAANEGAKISGCSVENTTVKAYRDFAGLVGFASCVTIENTTTRNVTLVQDLTHDYKAPNTPTTFGEFIGRDNGGNTIDGHNYVADGVLKDSEQNYYYLYNAAALKWLANEVNKYSNYEYPFKDHTLKLMNDVNLEGIEWTPIGDYRFSANRFCGTFDGQGHTISNFKITKKTDKNDSNKSSYGFFGNLEGTVKNLTIAGATINSYAYTGALVGRFNNGLIENCHVDECAVSNTYWQGGILIGQVNAEGNDAVVKNCSVKNSSVTSKSAIGVISGPVTATEGGNITFESCKVENCQVNQKDSFGGSYDNYFGTMFGYLEAESTSSINVNSCTATNTTVKGESDAPISGDIDGNVYIDGSLVVATEKAFTAALEAGKNMILTADIYLSKPIQVTDKTFAINGNGYKIGQSSDYPAEGTATAALIHPIGGKAVIKNVAFEDIKADALIRTAGTELFIDNITVKNCIHTKDQGLLRLLGQSTVMNSTFEGNNCKMVISLNFDANGDNTFPQVVKDCVFKENTCNTTAVVYYSEGGSATFDGNKFINNILHVSNGATLYLGFKKNCTVTNNLFDGNTVTATSKRSSGGLMVGNAAVVTGNAFVNNTVTVNGETGYGNDVCASPYYAAIDLSGNYWGGGAPVENDDYYKEYDNYDVIINDYLTENPIK